MVTRRNDKLERGLTITALVRKSNPRCFRGKTKTSLLHDRVRAGLTYLFQGGGERAPNGIQKLQITKCATGRRG